MENTGLYIMAAFYIYAGISHFRNPKFFLAITPKWVPRPASVNIITGLVEILLGIMILFAFSRTPGLYGIIILLIVVFPANIYHFQKSLRKNKRVWMTAIRLPIQLLLIYWAWIYL